MMTTTIKTQKWLLSLLSALFMLVVFTACSSTEGNDSAKEPELPQPETPINNDDWQTVSASGGTVEKGDLSITFPSGTFSSDVKVAVSEAQKGKTCGENEVSIFYQITLPVTTNKAFSLKIKCEEKADDIYFVARTPAFSLSEQKGQFHNYSLEGNYSNGEYTVTIPEADNGSNGETCNITIGLAHVLREPGGNMTRADHTIKWHFDSSNWTLIWTSQAQLDKLGSLKPIIGRYINDALTKIQDLGFKINEDRDIPIFFETGLDNKLYGSFCQDWREDKNSSIQLNQDKILAMGDDHTSLKCTIIHELLHYFQSEYDRRTPYNKAKTGAEDLIMYESGAVWVEQFMNNGKLNGSFIQQYIFPFVTSFKDLDAAYANDSQVKGTYKVYQDHGYAMSTLLAYVAKQTWADFSNQSIVELYEIWHEKWFPFACIEEWFRRHDYGLMSGCEYDDFILELAQGNIPSTGANIDANMLVDGSAKSLYEVGSIDNISGTCYPYGVNCHTVILKLQKDFDLTNKKLVIKQEKENVHTYVFINSSSGNKIYKTPVAVDSPLTIDASVLDGMRQEDGKGAVRAQLFTISTNIENNEPLPSNVSVELQGEEGQTGGASVSPDQLTYKWEGESQDVIIKKGSYKYCGADVPEEFRKWISVNPDADGKVSIAVQPNLTFERRDGKVNCWVSNKENPTDEEKKYIQPAVNITQGPVEGVDWNPKSLNFGAEGGSAKISFDFGGFKRFGAQVHEEGWNWCGVAAANGKLTITVQPNPSSESRECIVDAYVTNSQNPTEEDKVIMPITVFQEGNDGQTAANNLKELWGTWTFTYTQHDWNTVYSVTFGKDGSYYYECNDYKHPEESFTRTGTYKVLDFEAWNPTPEGVIGLADIEESFHNSLTGKDVVRQWTVRLYNNGQLGYENKLWKKAE